jgi:uncharacterized protein (TIGR00106 family)
MKVNAMLSIIPIGVGISLSRYVAACERVLEDAGVRRQLHAQGTNIEGEWDEVMEAIRRCVETVHEMGAPRVSAFVKLGTRTDRDPSSDEMVRSVETKLREH